MHKTKKSWYAKLRSCFEKIKYYKIKHNHMLFRIIPSAADAYSREGSEELFNHVKNTELVAVN